MRNAGAVIVGLAVLAAVIGPWVVPFDPSAQELALRLEGPSRLHWLGLDELGRDILARVVSGARVSLFVGLVVVSVSASIGAVMGSLAGYYGGIVDEVISRIIDILLAFPGLLLAIALVAVLGPSLTNVALRIGGRGEGKRGERRGNIETHELTPPVTNLRQFKRRAVRRKW